MQWRASQAPLSSYEEWLYPHTESVNNHGRQRCLILWLSKTKKIPPKKIFSKPLFLPIIPFLLHKSITVKKEYEKQVEIDKKTALYVKLGKKPATRHNRICSRETWTSWRIWEASANKAVISRSHNLQPCSHMRKETPPLKRQRWWESIYHNM